VNLIQALVPMLRSLPVQALRRHTEAMSILDGKVALVTGAGRGVGRATAIHFAECGARVALLARSRDELEGTESTYAGSAGPGSSSKPISLSAAGSPMSCGRWVPASGRCRF
jgi:short subunit dehydrogenase